MFREKNIGGDTKELMIVSKNAKVKWNSRNRKHYESKGYNFTNWSDEFEIDVNDLSSTSGTKVDVICDYCNNIFQMTYNHYCRATEKSNKVACKNCRKIKISETKKGNVANEIIMKLNEWCERKGYVPVTNASNYSTCRNLQYICKTHGLQHISSSSIDCYCGCNKCGNEIAANKQRLSQYDVQMIIQSKNNNILLNPEEYIKNTCKNLKVICGSCGNIFLTSLANVQQGDGHCYKCGSIQQIKSRTYKEDDVENIINSVNNNKLLNKEDYVNNSTRNLNILCGECDENIFVTNLTTYKAGKNMCDSCSLKMSNSERIIKDLLDSYHIPYIQEFRFPDCKDKKTLPFDFYLPDYNLCIEFDGEQHFKSIDYWGGNTRLQYIKNHDRIKEDYCKNNNISLLRIPYTEFNNINNILLKKLDLFPISKVYPKMIPKYRVKQIIFNR